MVAVVLALASGLLWGCADFGGGSLSRRLPVLAASLEETRAEAPGRGRASAG